MKKTSRGKLVMFKKMDDIIISPDEELSQHIQRFRKQKEELKQLTTSVNNFIKNMNKVNTTEIELMTTWTRNIDDWENLENFHQNAASLKAIRQTGIEKMKTEILIPLKTYETQFAETKARIDKYESSKVCYDRCRFVVKKLETTPNNVREMQERERQKLELSRQAYETRREQLEKELPSLYNSRKQFLGSTLFAMFSIQKTLHMDASYIFRDLGEYVLVNLKTSSL